VFSYVQTLPNYWFAAGKVNSVLTRSGRRGADVGVKPTLGSRTYPPGSFKKREAFNIGCDRDKKGLGLVFFELKKNAQAPRIVRTWANGFPEENT